MPDTETAATPVAETAEASSTQEGTEADAKLQAFAHAMDSAGLKARVPSGMKYHGGKTEAEAAATATSDAPAEGDKLVPRPGDKPAKKPNPYEAPADLTQRKLADSYAAYVRKSTKLAKQEADFSERVKTIEANAARIQEIEASIAKRQTELEAEFKRKADELDFLEKDPAEFLDRYAKRRNMSTAALYDRLLGAKLNDGRLSPEHAADDVKRELAKTQAEIEALKKKDADEHAEIERRAREAEAQQQTARAIYGEKVAFITHLREEPETAYPLLLEEAKANPEMAATKAYELAVAHHRAGNTLTVAQVAAEMERQLKYLKWREDEEAKAASTPAAASKQSPSEGTSDGVGASTQAVAAKPAVPAKAKSNGLRQASGPKTITQKMTARHTGQGLTTPRNDNERLKLAIAQWGKG